MVVFLTPLQAIAEEYVFRGYLTQAFGSLARGLALSRAVAVGVPAILFAAAHGTQSFPVFVDRLAFGLVAGVLVSPPAASRPASPTTSSTTCSRSPSPSPTAT